MYEGRPNVVNAIENRQVQLVINTPSGRLSQHDDSYIRKASIKYKIPYLTTIAAARGIEAFRTRGGGVKSLQAYHNTIR